MSTPEARRADIEWVKTAKPYRLKPLAPVFRLGALALLIPLDRWISHGERRKERERRERAQRRRERAHGLG